MTAATIALVLIIMAPDGSIRQQVEPRATLNACFADAARFVLRDPAEFGAAALGAGCLVHSAGRPS